MRYILLISFAFLSFASIKADNTFYGNQSGDVVIFNGTEYKNYNYILESYFNKYPNKKPKLQIQSSGLTRGYIGVFEVIDDVLYVTDIKLQVYDTTTTQKYDSTFISVYQEVFPNTTRKKVDWKTGFLELPYGEYFYSHYANYWVLEIKKGAIIQARDYTTRELNRMKKKQFEAYKETAAYRKLVDCYIQSNWFMRKEIDTHFTMRNNIFFHTKKFLVTD